MILRSDRRISTSWWRWGTMLGRVSDTCSIVGIKRSAVEGALSLDLGLFDGVSRASGGISFEFVPTFVSNYLNTNDLS